jgi:hypothetical protein
LLISDLDEEHFTTEILQSNHLLISDLGEEHFTTEILQNQVANILVDCSINI